MSISVRVRVRLGFDVEDAVAVGIAVEGIAAHYAAAAGALLLAERAPGVIGSGIGGMHSGARPRLLGEHAPVRNGGAAAQRLRRQRGGGGRALGAPSVLQATPPPCRGQHNVASAVSDGTHAQSVHVVAAVAGGAPGYIYGCSLYTRGCSLGA